MYFMDYKYTLSSIQSLDWSSHGGGGWRKRDDSPDISSFSLFCGRPLRAIPAWAGTSTLWRCPSSISSADQGVARPPRCPEGWFWRGCRGVWHARMMHAQVACSNRRTLRRSGSRGWRVGEGWGGGGGRGWLGLDHLPSDPRSWSPE